MSKENQKIDVLIIGAGPAGLAAAIYSSWLGLKTVVLESGIAGGRAGLAPRIENFPGFESGIKGSELAEKMRLQALRFHAEIKDNEEVIGLDLKSETKQVVSRNQTYEASALIIATGTQRRKLLVPGETDFIGRGVSYCVTCDGPFFRSATVAVVGNGEEAAVDALFLSEIASKILLVTHRQELNIQGTLMDRLRNKPNIEIIKGEVKQILGAQIVKAIRIIEYGAQGEVDKDVNGVFVSLGGVPMTAIVKNAGVITDRNGCLIVDRQQKTNIEGVFAAGDCTCGGMQVVTAAGEGSMAAMRASAHVRKKIKG
ncbi:MAG: FAD-dependent oxidoreductase [Candidatus Bathyarchaeia archaeon]|jgi:thioredoxin reductase (NADPH)